MRTQCAECGKLVPLKMVSNERALCLYCGALFAPYRYLDDKKKKEEDNDWGLFDFEGIADADC